MKVLSTVGLNPVQCRMLEASLDPADTVVDRRCRSQAEMIEAAQDGCEVLFSFRVPDELLRRAPGIKWVQLLSAGADHILKGYLAERNDIAVTTASGIHSTPIAEYTIGSMLAFAHGHRCFGGRWRSR